MVNTNSVRAVFSVQETAKLLGLSKNSTYAGIKSGDIPSIKVGARILVPKKALEKMLESKFTTVEPKE